MGSFLNSSLALMLKPSVAFMYQPMMGETALIRSTDSHTVNVELLIVFLKRSWGILGLKRLTLPL